MAFDVVVFSVVVFTTGAGTMLSVVVVVCDRSETCGAGSAGAEVAHPAAPRLPIRKVIATYAEVAFVLFFIASL